MFPEMDVKNDDIGGAQRRNKQSSPAMQTAREVLPHWCGDHLPSSLDNVDEFKSRSSAVQTRFSAIRKTIA
jgi:hypothetical protein